MDPVLPTTPVSWKPTPKIIAAGLMAVVGIAGALITLYTTNSLSVHTALPAVLVPLLPVVAGYLKSS